MYDEICELYHLVYDDWEAAIAQQAQALDGLFGRLGVVRPAKLLDVSCGIGTQAIGLAALGYQVSASDLSAGAVERAKREAASRELDITCQVADMRTCADIWPDDFDVVLSADNSIPHLPGRREIQSAATQFFRCLRSGGVVVVGLRNYTADEARTSPQVWPYGFRHQNGERYFVFQTRDWDGDAYRVGMYFVREARDGLAARVVAGTSTYYAISMQELKDVFSDVGFTEVQSFDDVLHQPVVAARRP
jgi:glycine/sarcosine N-methyltransferase